MDDLVVEWGMHPTPVRGLGEWDLKARACRVVWTDGHEQMIARCGIERDVAGGAQCTCSAWMHEVTGVACMCEVTGGCFRDIVHQL